LIKVAIIGDMFVRARFFEKSLRNYLAPTGQELSISSMENDWPDQPNFDNEELKEFVGDEKEIAEFCKDANAIVTQIAPISRLVIDTAKDLHIVACCRGGPVNINTKAATERGIPVIFGPGRNAQAVVEFTLGLMLTECKSISRAHCSFKHGIWRGDLYRHSIAPKELKGQTFGLVGFGIIAQMLAPYLRPFGGRILAYDPYVTKERMAELGVEKAELETLLQEADVISIHARVTPETTGMIGKKEFALMKEGAYFINTARGPLVDYDALYEALKSGHLAGAGLDTFAVEPPPMDWPLLKLDNVTLTPHIGGSSKETAERAADMVARDVANFYTGQKIAHCANPDVLKK
jgi:D-3-phosphoglycerate dehydrogenase / 2-oxoglutarate reductase